MSEQLTRATRAAATAERIAGDQQLQNNFLSKLDQLLGAIEHIGAMVEAVQKCLEPESSWTSRLDLSFFADSITDLRERQREGNFNVVGSYDNLSLNLEKVINSVKDCCNVPWETFRDSLFVSVDLDYEYPNQNVLRAISSDLVIPASFALSRTRLRQLSKMSFREFWDSECESTQENFVSEVQNIQTRIRDFQDVVAPVVEAMSATPVVVANFLEDAARGTADLTQVTSSEVSAWLDSKSLLDSFVVRFKD